MFTMFEHTAKRFSKDEAGSNALEYGLIVALVSLAVVAGATTAGTNLAAMFVALAGEITTVTGTAFP
jgi:pilus assembly protein Flp/PilA